MLDKHNVTAPPMQHTRLQKRHHQHIAAIRAANHRAHRLTGRHGEHASASRTSQLANRVRRRREWPWRLLERRHWLLLLLLHWRRLRLEGRRLLLLWRLHGLLTEVIQRDIQVAAL